MSFLTRWRLSLRALRRRNELDRTLRLEMETHVELYERDLRARGLDPGEAHRRARAEFGSIAARTEECRAVLGVRVIDDLRGDVTYALRLLRRSPGFAVAAVASLALGIGANTAIFSLIDMVMLKTLPVQDPASLAFVETSGGKSGGSSGPPYPLFELMRDNNRFFSGIAAFSEDRFKVTIDGAAEQVRGQSASGSYFELLGVHPELGRLLTPADDSIFGVGGPEGAAAVISHGFWRRRFGSDPTVIGRSIQVGTQSVTIVGVTPPEFFGLQTGSPIDLTIPMMLAGNQIKSKGMWWMSAVGRIRPGASTDQARAELDSLFDVYMKEQGMKRDGYFSGVALVPADRGLNALRRQFSEPLLIVMAIAAAVLLIGCANVANLLLARASARRSEISVRFAIGATRVRVLRQLLTEGAVLGIVGSVAGLGIAQAGVSFLVGLFADRGAGILLEPRFDTRVLGFVAVTSVITVMLFSVAPVLHALRVDAAKPGDANVSLTKPRVRAGQALTVLQVTLAMALLCSSALFVRTLHNLNTIDGGFRREHILSAQVEATLPPAAARPQTPAEHRQDHAVRAAMWEAFVNRAAGLPKVANVAAATMAPLTGRDRGVAVAIEDRNLRRPDNGTHVNTVTSGYFRTLGIQLLSGRLFTPRDTAAGPRVAILNQTAARAWFPDGSPIGKRISFPGQPVDDWYDIVGVVGDARYVNLRVPDGRMVYIPLEQALDPISGIMVVVQADGNPTALVPAIRSIAVDTIPGGFVTRIGTMEERVDRSLLRERLLSMLATFFGALALTLACVGLYGVLSYTVVRRSREIGIRMAVGAPHASVAWMILRETFVLVSAGMAIGLVAARLAARPISSQFFGVAPGDPVATAAAVSILLGVTLAAAYLPARRATRIDPVVAIRCE
jgi:putative ABC transport system permease protein